MVTAIVAAMFGSSMVMVSGPTTAISALLFATLEGVAVPGSARYIELALLLTLLVGVCQIVVGLARLGGLVSFVSHSVIVAFTAAAALLIAISQLAGVLGVKVEAGGNVVERLGNVTATASGVNPLAVLIAAATFVTVAANQALALPLPGILIALGVGAGIAALTDAATKGCRDAWRDPRRLSQLLGSELSVVGYRDARAWRRSSETKSASLQVPGASV